MKKMTKNEQVQTNGGYTYYRCNICYARNITRCYASKTVMKIHCKNNHGISTCFKEMHY